MVVKFKVYYLDVIHSFLEKMKAKQCQEFLKLMAESKSPKRRKLLVDWASNKDIDAISEIALNTLNGNIKLTPNIYRKIKKHKKIIRLLASTKPKINQKKKIIKQSGGFLPFLIPAAISAVSNLLPAVIKAIKRKKKK